MLGKFDYPSGINVNAISNKSTIDATIPTCRISPGRYGYSSGVAALAVTCELRGDGDSLISVGDNFDWELALKLEGRVLVEAADSLEPSVRESTTLERPFLLLLLI